MAEVEALRCNAVSPNNENCDYDKGHQGPHKWDREAVLEATEASGDKDDKDGEETETQT